MFPQINYNLLSAIHVDSPDLLCREINLVEIQFAEGWIFVGFVVEEPAGQVAEGDPLGRRCRLLCFE